MKNLENLKACLTACEDLKRYLIICKDLKIDKKALNKNSINRKEEIKEAFRDKMYEDDETYTVTSIDHAEKSLSKILDKYL